MTKSAKDNPALCLAPWTHTYVSPQSERRLCCASREEHSYVHQYIDRPGEKDSSEYKPQTLEEHWNSPYMRDIRKRMLAGEKLPQCEVCHDQTLNIYTYRQYFNGTLFPELLDQVAQHTSEDGATDWRPRSFDYRVSNLCNFKCRMCGEQLSSAWEDEKRKHNLWHPEHDAWMAPENKEKIDKFTKNVVISEFKNAIERGDVEEIYWVGGEPLVWPEHWEVMNRLKEKGDIGKVITRYNTNLSMIRYRGTDLFKDLLPYVKRFNLCASIDGAGKVGEFVRSGLNWQRWLSYFEEGVELGKTQGDDGMVFDVTLTLPGLFGMVDLMKEAKRLDVKAYVKIVYAFDSSVLMSPFALPKEVLHSLIDDLIKELIPFVTPKTSILIQTLKEMKNRPTFREQYPDWQEGFKRGKQFAQTLADIRRDGEGGRLRIEDIYAQHPDVLAWWEGRL